MIPLRDLNPTRRNPVVTWCLVAANVTLFFFELYLEFTGGPQDLKAFINAYAVIPARFAVLHDVSTLVTSTFLHGGFLHLLGNMWFLWIFGDNVEDKLGHGRYLLFYVLAGIAAGLCQIVIAPASTVPMIGASGAIAGVLAGYVVLFPHARVVTLVPIFIFIQFIELPAFVFIFVWFGFQLLEGYVSLGAVAANMGGTAFFAHIGGFVFGLLLIRTFRPGGERRSRSGQGRRVVYRPRDSVD
ncbi:MAG: rhomboid family intramembrane serine protease [Myxococcales bacterium]|nr:rhomboid family intramembrane serine protease [Myxococcales bacterium]